MSESPRIPLLLVTGFLGSGKTSFLKRLISRFSPCASLYVIVNEFGKEGVDGTLLDGTGGKISEIAGGSIFCSCRMDRFEEVLSDGVLFCAAFLTDCRKKNEAESPESSQKTMIVVETSGFSDPSAIMAILEQERFAAIEYAGCLCLADALFFEKVFSTARAVKRQLGIADAVLLNKTDITPREQKQRVHELLAQNYPEIHVFETVYGELPPDFFCLRDGAEKTDRVKNQQNPDCVDFAQKQDLYAFLNALRFYADRFSLCETETDGGKMFSFSAEKSPVFQPKDITLQKMTLSVSPKMSVFDFEKCVRMCIEDTYRIKGIIRLAEGLFLADCVGNRFSLSPYPAAVSDVENSTDSCENGKLTLLAGRGMNLRRAVLQAVQWYVDFVKIEED